jgi:rsbT antagonist protein RsbS
MPTSSGTAPIEPLLVSILKQGPYLIASIHSALDDGQLLRFRQTLLERIGGERATGVVIDVAALDVLDSFGTHTLRTLAQIARLRGARTVIVGINPDVALAMVQLGMELGDIDTALDLEEGLAVLRAALAPDAATAPPARSPHTGIPRPPGRL